MTPPILLADVTIPTAWLPAALFGLVVTVLGWLLKGKAERWDDAAKRSHELANELATVSVRVEILERDRKKG